MSGVVNICEALLVVVLPVGVLCGTVYTTVSFVLYTSILVYQVYAAVV